MIQCWKQLFQNQPNKIKELLLKKILKLRKKYVYQGETWTFWELLNCQNAKACSWVKRGLGILFWDCSQCLYILQAINMHMHMHTHAHTHILSVRNNLHLQQAQLDQGGQSTITKYRQLPKAKQSQSTSVKSSHPMSTHWFSRGRRALDKII